MGRRTTKSFQEPVAFRLVKRYSRGEGCYLSDSQVTLTDLVTSIKSGKYACLAKNRLPGIVLNQFSSSRRYVDLKYLTGWWAFDVDKCTDASQAQWIKAQLFKVPQIKIAFISNSGLGVKAIGYWPNMPRFSVVNLCCGDNSYLERQKVKQYYQSLCNGFGSFGTISPKFDSAQGVLTQPIWFSSDKDILSKL